MEHIYLTAAFWLGLGVLSAIIAYHIKLSIASVEIIIGIAAAFAASSFLNKDVFSENSDWIKFLAGSGSIFLTFLAGAELDKHSIKEKFKESAAMGAASFFVSFVLIFIFSFYVLKWSYQASIITASSLSSTSIAIIYSIMTEKGLNKTSLGKGILGACFVNGFLTLSSLSLFFQKTDYKTLVFLFFSLFTLFIFPYLTSHLTNVYGNRTAAIRSKWVSFFLFSYGALALWAKTEPVLAAYIAGVALGEFAGNNSQWIRRMRTLTVGFFTSFYFLRVGIMCSIDVFYSSLGIIILFFIVRFIGKYAGLYPVSGLFMKVKKERFFYSMLLTTGLTFDTIAAVFGYSHSIIDKTQYSVLIAVIILAAIIPGFIANKYAPARAAHEQLKEEYQE